MTSLCMLKRLRGGGPIYLDLFPGRGRLVVLVDVRLLTSPGSCRGLVELARRSWAYLRVPLFNLCHVNLSVSACLAGPGPEGKKMQDAMPWPSGAKYDPAVLIRRVPSSRRNQESETHGSRRHSAEHVDIPRLLTTRVVLAIVAANTI